MKNKSKKIYIVGIEGAGTSALAQIYKNFGHEVFGSDEGDHFYGDILKKAGIKVFEKFDAKNVPEDIDFAVYSTSNKEDNPEIIEIRKKREIKLLQYSEALGEIFSQKTGIAVCGTHGKTTTTALLAQVLKEGEKDPLALVGSKVIDWQSNVLLGQSEFFVAEADEYQNKLALYNPWAVILTSVDFDHPDFFADENEYKKVFVDFASKIPKTGFLVVWGDSANTLEVAKNAKCEALTYGFGGDNDYIIKDFKSGEIQNFEIFEKEKSLGVFQTKLTGKHNALNIAAAIVVSRKMKVDLEKTKQSLREFQGTVRRFQYVGQKNETIFIDDYAHHPDEIKATLAGARGKFADKKILVIFQPHTFSRTEALLSEFSQSFDDADTVWILDIYQSREKIGNVSSRDLVDLINKYDREKAEYISSIPDAVKLLGNESENFDIVLTMGAGNVWEIGKEFLGK